MPTDIIERITEYLSLGGLWNPESMEHNKVRDLLMDCRDELARLRSPRSSGVAEPATPPRASSVVDWPKLTVRLAMVLDNMRYDGPEDDETYAHLVVEYGDLWEDLRAAHVSSLSASPASPEAKDTER